MTIRNTFQRAILLLTSIVILLALIFGAAPSRKDSLKHFESDSYTELESGVRRLSDGTLEVAAFVRMPEVTPSMYYWWFTDYLQTTNHYKRWHPEDHVWMDWENKLAGQIIGAHHLVHEYIGGEMNKLRIQFVQPKAILGYDPSDDSTQAVCAVVGELESDMDIAEMCHVIRSRPWGSELRSRFWLGLVKDREGSAVVNAALGALVNPVTRRIAISYETGLSLQRHATEEMSILASFLPDLYKEETHSLIHDK